MSDNVIAVLSSDLIDRIAAGEVIERPASVLKELVENALDARASRVEVELQGGGTDLICVSDNGMGMSASDCRLCFTRHATSKIRTSDDLFRIQSFGFRGEALSSIAAVARVKLQSRRAQDQSGTAVEIEGGEIKTVSEIGCPVGTRIEVRDLFFNTPARRKFLRSPATEQAHCRNFALRTILAHPSAALVLTAQGRTLLNVPQSSDLKARLAAAFSGRFSDLRALASQRDGIHVHGFVDAGDDGNSVREHWFFVNGRFVRDRVLQRALQESGRGLFDAGSLPHVFLAVDLDQSAVDVNVHPQKLEVRFSDSSAVFRATVSALVSAFAEASADLLKAQASPYSMPAPLFRAVENSRGGYSPSPLLSPEGGQPPVSAGEFTLLDDLTHELSLLRSSDALFVLNRRKIAIFLARQRVELQLEGGPLAGHPLLFPESMELSEAEQKLVAQNSDLLARLACEFEQVAPRHFALRRVPEFLSETSPMLIARAVLDLLNETDDAATIGDVLCKLSPAVVDGEFYLNSLSPLELREMEEGGVLKKIRIADLGV